MSIMHIYLKKFDTGSHLILKTFQQDFYYRRYNPHRRSCFINRGTDSILNVDSDVENRDLALN